MQHTSMEVAYQHWLFRLCSAYVRSCGLPLGPRSSEVVFLAKYFSVFAHNLHRHVESLSMQFIVHMAKRLCLYRARSRSLIRHLKSNHLDFPFQYSLGMRLHLDACISVFCSVDPLLGLPVYSIGTRFLAQCSIKYVFASVPTELSSGPLCCSNLLLPALCCHSVA